MFALDQGQRKYAKLARIAIFYSYYSVSLLLSSIEGAQGRRVRMPGSFPSDENIGDGSVNARGERTRRIHLFQTLIAPLYGN
jgi:hypothetical protein